MKSCLKSQSARTPALGSSERANPVNGLLDLHAAFSHIRMCNARDFHICMYTTESTSECRLEPMQDDDHIERARAALRRFLDSRKEIDPKWSVRSWAKDARVSPNLIYNFLRGDSQSIHPDSYAKLANAEGVPVFVLTGEQPSATLVYTFTVRGDVEAGVWREAHEWAESDWFTVSSSFPKRYARSAFGLLVKGQSMSAEYPEDTILICVSTHEFFRDIKHGDHVIVERVSRGGEREATVKEIQVIDGKTWLVPKSLDPRYSRPIDPQDNDDDIDHTEISAVVIGSTKLRPDIQ